MKKNRLRNPRTFNVRIENSELERLRELSFYGKRSIGALVRVAISDYLEKTSSLFKDLKESKGNK
jgi:hypothetical protein